MTISEDQSSPDENGVQGQITSLERSYEDRVDDFEGHQIKFVYLLPSDGTDKQLDTNGTLERTIRSFQKWMTEKTDGMNLTVDTYEGSLDILFHQMTKTDSEMSAFGQYVQGEMEIELSKAGLIEDNKIYAVYYEGTSTVSCGIGPWPPTSPGQVTALFLHGLPDSGFPCDQNKFSDGEEPAGYLEFVMLHEIFHAMGFAPEGAPNTVGPHTTDSSTDLMYFGEESWIPSVIDFGNDDYFNHDGDQLDLADSLYLNVNRDKSLSSIDENGGLPNSLDFPFLGNSMLFTIVFVIVMVKLQKRRK